MPRSCAAAFCRSNWENVKKRRVDVIFHQFPPDSAQCHKWIQFCKRENNWKPTRNSTLCSLHFKNEDYQLCESGLANSNINFKRLKLTAVPSTSIKGEKGEHEDTGCDVGAETDPKLLDYRQQVCRTCLRHCKNETLISIDSQIQNMTVLEMLIQLTAFETENNDAFPTVVCLECKHNLEQAFNIRQEFIAQAELLIQLVAEEKILEYCIKDSMIEPPDSNVSEDHEISDLDDETHSVDHEYTGNVIDHQQLHISDENDHSCYTKIRNPHEDDGIGDVVKEEAFMDENKDEAEDTPAQSQALKQDKSQESQTKSKRTNAGRNSHNYRGEKTSIQKQKAGMRRGLKRQHSEKFGSRIKRLEAEARKRFPFTTCYVCDKEHDTLVERDFHMQAHIPMLPYECKECIEINGASSAVDNGDSSTAENEVKEQPAVSNTLHQLNLHFRMHHLPYQCDKCYRRFSTMTNLKTHQWASHQFKGNGLTCEYCGKQYGNKIAFRKHIDAHRKKLSEQLKCTICDRTFGVKSSLQRHEASHKGERKYKCTYCDKAFSTSYNRLTHQRTAHTGEQPFKCLVCDRTFAQNTMLEAHQALCTAEKVRSFRRRISGPPLLPSKDGHCPYPGCNYTAKSYAAMYVHKRAKHMPLYQCEVCNKSFAFKSKLNDHIMLHTGEKPHQCKVCDRSFRRLEIYRRHLQTHDSDSSHVCPICRKSFKLPYYLQAHMLTHSSERKFTCETCDNRYKTKGELKKHIQRKHADEIVEEIVVKTENAFVVEFVDVKKENKNAFVL